MNPHGEAASQLEREITEADLSSLQLITIIYDEQNQSVVQFPNQNSEALQRLRQDANDPNCIDFTYSVVLSLPDMRKGLYHIYQTKVRDGFSIKFQGQHGNGISSSAAASEQLAPLSHLPRKHAHNVQRTTRSISIRIVHCVKNARFN